MSDEVNSPALDNSVLVQKLAEACDAVKGVEKKGYNEGQKYKYQKAADVAMAMRHELFSRGIIIIPDEKEIEYVSIETIKFDGKTSKQTEARLGADFHIIGHGSEIVIHAYGVARDSGDKAIWKAKTGALKYLLRGLGLIPDEKEDPEFDRSNERPETSAEIEHGEEPKTLRLAGIIKRETEAETAFWYAMETLDNNGVTEVKIRANKATDDGRLAEKVGYLVEVEVLPATRNGKPIPEIFVLVGVLSVRQPEQEKPPLKPMEVTKSNPSAKKGASTRPLDSEPTPSAEDGYPTPSLPKKQAQWKAADTLIDKSMLITLQTARKRVKIPDADYYNLLGHHGYEHAPEIRVIDAPKILQAINEYRLTVAADDVNMDAEPA